MLGTQKLLYILPDLAYTAEVLKGKKEGQYEVQSFHQINGEFMADDNLLPENLKKLFEKIEPEEYTLVLPDFLFADTIVSVPSTDDAEIANYLREDLLPKLGVSTLTHETKTTILMQRKNESRVQFSAFEKELADILAAASSGREIKILDIVPLSWTIKSVVNLDPSISVIQIGTRLYLAEHYVGINQTSNAPLDEVDNILESITTLKGAEPNLQTLYLLTNALVEEKMRAALAKTLPVQQLTLPGDDNLQMPSYLKQIIEAGGATLNDVNYPVPHFAIGNPVLTTTVVAEEVAVAPEKEEEITVEQEEEMPVVEEEKGEVEVAVETEKEEVVPEKEEEAAVEEEAVVPVVVVPAPEVVEEVSAAEVVAEPEPVVEKKVVEEEVKEEETPMKAESVPEVKEEPAPLLDKTEVSGDNAETVPSQPEEVAPVEKVKTETKEVDPKLARIERLAKKEKDGEEPKKKGGVGEFFKKLLLFVLVFALTIAVGLGVGYGVLKFTGGKNTPTPTPEPVVVATPEPEPVVEASPSADASASAVEATPVEKDTVKILVINATGVAGLAGKVKTTLTDDDFVNVTTGNAKGEYTEEEDLVLMSSKSPSLISALEEASGRTLTFDEDYQTEDPNGDYDAVIVLNVAE